MRIHTFGIGGDCDRQLIQDTAKAGRGTSSFAVKESDNLSGLVISALKKSMVASLQNCEFTFCGKQISLGEVYQDQSVHSYLILSKEEFVDWKVSFESTLDPVSKQPISLKFSKPDFELTDLPLFKLAAHE